MIKAKSKTFGLLLAALLLASMIVFGRVSEIQAQVGTETVTYTIEAGPYNITRDEQGFDKIAMLGYGTIESPGDPVLPEKTFEFWVRQDINWSSVELVVNVQLSEELSGSYNIRPGHPGSPVANESWYDPEYQDWGTEKNIVNGSNTYIYGRDADYPEQPFELAPYVQRKEPEIIIGIAATEQAEQGFEENNYLRLAFRPFLYNPVRYKLTLIKKALVNITYDYRVPVLMGQDVVIEESTTYDYVIITTNDIVSNSGELASFVHLKELYGHSVKVVTEDDFDGLTGQAPNGRAEKIRQWLINNYQPLGIDYVLLIGDPDPDDPIDPIDSVGDIPMKMCWPNYLSLNYRESPTDYIYADLTGNWDLDGDQRFGEGLESNHIISPDPAIGADTFSARWTGEVMFDFTDTYQLQTFSDEGVRLYIDGSLIIDNWIDHLPASNSAWQAMTAGRHDITLEFRENTGDSVIQLLWSCSYQGQPNYVQHGIIPSNHLYDASDNVGGLTGTYYDNADFTGTSITRKDNIINFIWGTGDKGVGGPDVGAEVFVGRIPVYDSDFVQLDSVLKKTIMYETDPGNIDWRKTVLLPMKPLWPDTPAYHLGEGIRNDYALASGFTCYRIYDSDYSPPTPENWPCNVNNVKDEWKSGYGVVVWATHGSPTSAGDVFDSTLTHELNDSKPSFTFQASCLNGYPEADNNIGYALLKEGAVATVSASRVSWDVHGSWTFSPNSGWNHNLAYYYTKRIIQDSQSAGVALYLTKGGCASVGMNEMDYNLYGDPECYLLTVVPDNPPTAEAGGPYVQDEGKPIAFDASGSTDLDGNTLQYRWDFENDGTWDTAWSSDPKASYTWGDDYVGTAKVEASDGLVTDTDTASVEVLNVAPSINETMISPLNPDNPEFILPTIHDLPFTASANDTGSDDLSFTWDWGDGTEQTTTYYNDGLGPDPYPSPGGTYPFIQGDSVGHVYSEAGTYVVTLTVEDDDGGVASTALEVKVLSAEEAKEMINEYIQSLPKEAFRGNPAQRKRAFSNMFSAIDDMLADEEYNGAIEDLKNNVRSKADGTVDGYANNDWIIDATAQHHICWKIDMLIAYLETLL